VFPFALQCAHTVVFHKHGTPQTWECSSINVQLMAKVIS
jgi:hypothetical protein